MIDRVSGMISAAPSPCTVRAKISISMLRDNAPSSDAPVKTTNPNMNQRFRPKRSPSPPAVICNAAKTSVF